MDAEWNDPDDGWGDELDYQELDYEEVPPDALDQVDRALLSDWEMESVAYAERVAEGYDFEAERAEVEAEEELELSQLEGRLGVQARRDFYEQQAIFRTLREERARFEDIELRGGYAAACLWRAGELRERAPHAHHLQRPTRLREAAYFEAKAEEHGASPRMVRWSRGDPAGFAAGMRATGAVEMTELQAWDYGYHYGEKVSKVVEDAWDLLLEWGCSEDEVRCVFRLSTSVDEAVGCLVDPVSTAPSSPCWALANRATPERPEREPESEQVLWPEVELEP